MKFITFHKKLTMKMFVVYQQNQSNNRLKHCLLIGTLLKMCQKLAHTLSHNLLLFLLLFQISLVICGDDGSGSKLNQSMHKIFQPTPSLSHSTIFINQSTFNISSSLSTKSFSPLSSNTITIQLFNKSAETNEKPSVLSIVKNNNHNLFNDNQSWLNQPQPDNHSINNISFNYIPTNSTRYLFSEVESLSLRYDDDAFVTELYPLNSLNDSIESNMENLDDFDFVVDPNKCLHIFSCNLRYSLSWTIVLFIAYLVVFFIGLVGNISVLWIVSMLRRETNRRHSCGAGCGTIYCKSTAGNNGTLGQSTVGNGTPGGAFYNNANNTANNFQNSQSFYCQHQTHLPIIQISRSNAVFYRFVCNLALADLLVVLFCLPPTLIGNIYLPWVLGRVVCKAVPYLQGVSVNASVYTLVAISIDRFYAIYYPLNKKCSTALCWTTILLIWSLSFAISSPWLIYFDVIPLDTQDYPTLNNGHSVQICRDIWPSIEMENGHFLVVNLGFQYLIPLSIIALFYILILKKIAERKLPKLARHLPANVKDGNRQSSLVIERSKVKVFKMLIVLVLLFALSWLPLYVIFFMIKIGPRLDEQSWTSQILHTGVPVAQWLGASNSCVNPILYFFFNAKFRSYYRMTWLKTFSCLRILRPSSMMGGGSGVATSASGRHHPQNHNINNEDKSTVTAV